MKELIKLNPIMISNNDKGCIAFSNKFDSTYMLFDGNTSFRLYSDNAYGCRTGIVLNKFSILKQFKIYFYGNDNPINIQLWASKNTTNGNDGNWTKLEFDYSSNGNCIILNTSNNTKSYKAYCIICDRQSYYWLSLTELELFGEYTSFFVYKDNKYYNPDNEYYNKETKEYSEIPFDLVIKNSCHDINIFFDEVDIENEKFKPIDKLEKFNLILFK